MKKLFGAKGLTYLLTIATVGLLLGAIQALIFSLLSAVYITLWLPNEHEHAEGH